MSYHGPEKTQGFMKHEQLYDWVSNYDCGIMGYNYGEIPTGCVDFVIDQYARFGIPFHKDIFGVVQCGGSAACYFLDVVDPYAIFFGMSDVNINDDWQSHTYEIRDDYYSDGMCREADPEHIETYRWVPGQCEEIFNYCMSHPGLEAIPNGIGMGIKDLLNGDYNSEEWLDGLDSQTETALALMCTEDVNGIPEVNRRKMHAYVELAAWASAIWIMGPYGRGGRCQGHPIFDTCAQFGECIMVDGMIIDPTRYTRLARPPKTCYRCGIDAWCIEMTLTSDTGRYICESCASTGMRQAPGVTCGTRMCRFSSCPHHPFHAHGWAGSMAATRQHGQLMAAARGETFLHSSKGRKLLK